MWCFTIIYYRPYFFDIKAIKKRYNLPIRIQPNTAVNELIPKADPLCGAWIRPEDTDLYEPYVDTFQFKAETLDQEFSILEIYKKKLWPGNLALLIQGLNYSIDNRIVPPDFIESRLRCKQRCKERPGSCNLCHSAFDLTKTIRDEYYRRELERIQQKQAQEDAKIAEEEETNDDNLPI